MEQYPNNENKFKILIIDDEGDTCYLLKNVLKDEHFEIDHVNTLSQAGIFLKEEQPSLIFLDNRLPDGLGMNALEALKQDYPNMKIVMITGSGSNSDRKKAINRGADVYLTKPFTREQVFEAVEQLSGVHLDD
jgi:two-component system, OmpR family, response regulator